MANERPRWWRNRDGTERPLDEVIDRLFQLWRYVLLLWVLAMIVMLALWFRVGIGNDAVKDAKTAANAAQVAAEKTQVAAEKSATASEDARDLVQSAIDTANAQGASTDPAAVSRTLQQVQKLFCDRFPSENVCKQGAAP